VEPSPEGDGTVSPRSSFRPVDWRSAPEFPVPHATLTELGIVGHWLSYCVFSSSSSLLTFPPTRA